MKSIKILLITTTLLSSAAMAQQRYKAPNGIYCATPAVATQALTAPPDVIAQLTNPATMSGPECAKLGPSDTFTVLDGDPSDDAPKRIGVPNSPVMSELYIAGPIVKTSDPAKPLASSTCSPGDTGPGGEVDRLEAARDGTLKLKRYLLTSRCVKGQMRAFWKHLN